MNATSLRPVSPRSAAAPAQMRQSATSSAICHRSGTGASAATIQNEEVPDVIAYWIKELRATRQNVHGLAVGPTFHLDASAMWLS